MEEHAVIVNILRFGFRDGTTDEDKEKVLAAMRRTGSLESVAFSAVGQDLRLPDDGYTHTYIAGVADLAALERYMHDPLHIGGDDVILPHIAKLSGLRMSDDPDPGVSARVAALHEEKVAMYPEWGRSLDTVEGRASADS
ncbi:Dabb family protein [Nocardiopsis mangrovi]|uniref:Dabb family protein n=1 Tax=Nocardiopsis mangrovi TaxID=1179818 RepID=A0ABV9DZC7_9ACTN